MDRIISHDWEDRPVELVHRESGEPVHHGDIVEGSRVVGGRGPHKPSSSGRVWIEYRHDHISRMEQGTTRGCREVFPHAIGLEWRRIP